MRSRQLEVTINPNSGAIQELHIAGDATGMSWTTSNAETPSHPGSSDWGLGYFSFGYGHLHRFETPNEVFLQSSSARVHYCAGDIRVTVEREFTEAGCLKERYQFQNVAKDARRLACLGVFVPFNDSYPDAATCRTRRCHAHIWCGGHSAYVCAIRMGATPPHLGLVVTQGRLNGYAIHNRTTYYSTSNTRGDIALLAADIRITESAIDLPPAQAYSIEWVVFPHVGWDDFLEKARLSPQFLDVRADSYTVEDGRSCMLQIRDQRAVEVPGAASVDMSKGVQSFSLPVERGSQPFFEVPVRYDKYSTRAVVHTPGNIHQLVERRVEFIRERQQVLNPSHPLHGAYLVYDNELDVPVTRPRREDFSEGRERVGMGVLLARHAAQTGSQASHESLRLYYRFVRNKLQDGDYNTYSNIRRDDRRLYNYPWVVQLYLELYRVFGDAQFLRDAVGTVRAHYRNGGNRHYSFHMPILQSLELLQAAGQLQQREELLGLFREHGDTIERIGTDYPVHEVNYEQTIVAPAVLYMTELYLVTREPHYLEQARMHLNLLEAFNGRQPDCRLNDISIRHWDGYWFGKEELWGDTMPHYWSTVTALAFGFYAKATDNQEYRRRAEEIVRQNLALFTPHGRGSAAFIYPVETCGRDGAKFDPYANDQDWALVFYLGLRDL